MVIPTSCRRRAGMRLHETIDRNVRGKQSRLGLYDSYLHLKALRRLPSERRPPETICDFNGKTYVIVKDIYTTEFLKVYLLRIAGFLSESCVSNAIMVYQVPFVIRSMVPEAATQCDSYPRSIFCGCRCGLAYHKYYHNHYISSRRL